MKLPIRILTLRALLNHVSRRHIAYLLIILSLAAIVRVPLVFQHFQDCDDCAKCMTYAPGRGFAGVCYDTLALGLANIFDLTIFEKRQIIVFMGRTASLMLSVLGLVSLWSIIRKIWPSQRLLALCVTTVASFSQMGIIYSVNSGPYGNSLLCHAMLILILLHICRHGMTLRNTLLQSGAVFFLIHMDLTILFALPAFLLTVAFDGMRNRRKGFGSRFAIMTSLIVFSVGFIQHFFLAPVMHRGASNYSVGIDREFSFHGYEDLLTRGPTNFALLIENHLASYPSLEWQSIGHARVWITLLVLPAILIGFIYLCRRRPYLGCYVAVFLVTVLVLGVQGRIALFAPTRHTLGYTGVFLILLAAALAFLHDLHGRTSEIACLFIGFASVIAFQSSFPEFIKDRKNKCSFARIEAAAIRFNVAAVIPGKNSTWLGVEPGQVWWRKEYERDPEDAPRVNIMFVSHSQNVLNHDLIVREILDNSNTRIDFFETDWSGTQTGRSVWVDSSKNACSIMVISVTPVKAASILRSKEVEQRFVSYW